MPPNKSKSKKSKNKKPHNSKAVNEIKDGKMEENCIYKIQSSDILGRYLVAGRNITPGEIIIDEQPLVVGPGTEIDPVCLGCYIPVNVNGISQYRCPGCKWPLCDKNCHGIGKFSGHSEWECLKFKELKTYEKLSKVMTKTELKLLYEIILPWRILQLKTQNPENYLKILEMESHLEMRKMNIELWEHYQKDIVEELIKFWGIQEFTETEIHTICGIIDVNCFEIGDNEAKARALYPNAFLLVHDCTQNTNHKDDPETQALTIRSSRFIKKGESITLSYAYTFQGTYQRRKYLYEGKLFWCQCKRCSDPSEFNTNTSALLCSNCANDSLLLPKDPLDQNSQWKCNKCKFEMSATIVVSLLDKLYAELESIAPDDVPSKLKYLAKYEKVLSKNHYLCLSAKYLLCQTYGRTDGYLIHEMSLEDIKRKEQYCRDLLEVVSILEPGLSRLKGIIMYELHAPIMVQLTTQMSLNQISRNDFRRRLKEVIKLLTDSKDILKLDPVNSSEYEISVAAANALKSLGSG